MATFTNRATLTYNTGVANSNVVTGELTEVLSVSKTADRASYRAGDEITYVVSIVNTGAAPFTGLTLTDNLGAYPFNTGTVTPLTYVDASLRYYSDGTLQPTPTVSQTAPLTVTGLTIPAGGSAMLLYRATVNEYAPLGEEGTIRNTVTVSGGTLTQSVTAEETVPVLAGPDLRISKSLCPSTVVENGTLRYTFNLYNDGNSAAAAGDNVVLSDTFNPILRNLTVTYNGTTLNSPADYTYDETTGAFATIPGVITVPAATYDQSGTGVWTVDPGAATVTVTGTI